MQRDSEEEVARFKVKGRDLSIGVSLALIIVILFASVVSLLAINNLRADLLSGVRAYVNGEGLYSKGQKDAVNYLSLYAESRMESDYLRFQQALSVPLGDARARRELEKPNPDMKLVAEGFLAGRNHPDDIDNMAKLFLRFRRVDFMARAIELWTQGDGLIEKLRQLGEGLHAVLAAEPVDAERVTKILREVHALNEELTVLEDDFSRTLGQGNRWLERRLLQLMYGATALLLAAGAFASTTILRGVRAANQTLRTQAERWRVTLASIGDAVLVTDARGSIVSLNAAAEALSGWKAAEAVGRNLQEVFRVRDDRSREPGEDLAYRVIREGEIVGLDNHAELWARDGSRRPIDDSAAPIKDEKGNIVGAVVVFRDVSERRSAEEEMRRSEERYRSLVAVTTSVVWTTDAQGRFVSPQRSWEAYTGRDWKLNAQGAWLNALHPDDRDAVATLWTRALAEPSVLRAEGRSWNAASGKYRYCVAHAVPLLNADASVREWIGTLTDVDDRKRAEEGLRRASQQKDDFLAMLAHELRNPLSPLRSAVYLLQRGGLAEAQVARTCEMIDRQVGHMTRLLDDLLDVSRVARGKISLRQDVVDLVQIVRLTGEDYRSTLESRGLILSLHLPETPLWILGDSTRLTQCVGNLLHNAGKFSNSGDRITIDLSSDSAGETALLTISDTGIGMAPEILDSVFDTFSQADQSLDRSRGGLGLGLALVKGLVELHGGSVHASSAGLGKGAQFLLRLPLHAAPVQVDISSKLAAHPSRPRRIVIIEDNPDVAQGMRYLLEADGHDVTVASTGKAGVEAVHRVDPEVVLCDIGLPGEMDGFEVARTLRRAPALTSPYLVALTGYGQEEYQRQARNAGFDVHLTKPVDPTVLDELLANLPARAEV